MTRDADPLIGQILDGRYRVERLVGGGGMGRVYEGVQIDLGRRVALKVMLPELAREPLILERFRREAQAAGVLANPHICDVTGFYSPEQGAPFLVMERLEGETLTDALARDGAFEIGRARRLCVQLLDGLQEAHEAGIVHRDLKPDNVFLQSLADGQEMVKLLDFGVAKLTESTAGSPQLTAVGAMVGTPRFASPEQLRGEPADLRSDVYGAGIILFGMLTGRPPFNGRIQEVIKQVLNEAPPDVRIANPSIEPHLAQVVARALAKSPGDRFQSAEEMLRALGGRRAKAGRAALRVADVRRAAEAQKASRRKEFPWKRLAMVGGAVGVALVITGLVGVGGYLLGSSAEAEAGAEAAVTPASTGAACEELTRRAQSCPGNTGAEATARARRLVAGARDTTRTAVVEGWCRVQLDEDQVCRAAPPPPTIPLTAPSVGGDLLPNSWTRADGSYGVRYELSLAALQPLVIRMQGASLDSHIILTAPSGRTVAAAEARLGQEARIDYLPTETGAYVLEVGGDPGQTGPFALTVERESPGSASAIRQPTEPRERRSRRRRPNRVRPDPVLPAVGDTWRGGG